MIQGVQVISAVMHVQDPSQNAIGIYKLGWFGIIYVPSAWIAEASGVRHYGDEGDIVLNSTADPQYVNTHLAMVGAYGLGIG